MSVVIDERCAFSLHIALCYILSNMINVLRIFRVADEIEALEAILMEDVKVKRIGEVPDIIETIVHPSTGDDTDQQFVCVTLEVKLTPGYPDNSPIVTLRNSRGLDDSVLATINSQIREKLSICLGQPVVFELIEVSIKILL